MAQVILNGKVYTIYENLPTIEPDIKVLKTAYSNDSKKRNQENRRNMARYNYRKK